MTPRALTALIDATWPAKSIATVNGWTIRTGAGGGNRVSAATQSDDEARVADAEGAMRASGQIPLFMIRGGETALDQTLNAAGYRIKDPVTIYTAPTDIIATQRPPPVTCFEVWPPLAAQAEIWSVGGVDDARLTIMTRAKGPKTTVLGRIHDTPAGAAFAAIHNGTAMLHAIETLHAFRRQGVARHMIRALAFWAQARRATQISLLVTTGNIGANALYSSMGFSAATGYHYRIHPEAS